MTLTDDDRASLIAQARDLAKHGSRMAWLLIDVVDAKDRLEGILATRDKLLAAKDDMIRGLCDRVEAQSQLLAKRAEVKTA